MRAWWPWLLCCMVWADASTPVTLVYENADLREVLVDFQTQADVTLVFGDALIEGLRVSVSVRDLSAREALDEVLSNFELEARWLNESRAVLLARQTIELEELRIAIEQRIQVDTDVSDGVSISADQGYLTFTPAEIPGQSAARDLFQTLDLLPGLESTVGEGGIGIQGSRPSENLVLLDGISLYQLDHALGYISALNEEALEEVQVFRGGYPATYGGRVAGVLDLRALDGSKKRLQVGTQRDMAGLTFGWPLSDRVSLLVSARESLDDGSALSVYDRLFQVTFDDQAPTNFEDVDIDRALDFEDQLFKLTVRPSLATHVTATYYNGEDRSTESFRDADDDEFVFWDKQGRWGNEGYSLNATHIWSAAQMTTARVFRSEFFSDFDLGEFDFDTDVFLERLLQNEVRETSWDLRHQWRHNEAFILDVGVARTRMEARYDRLADVFDEEEFEDDELDDEGRESENVLVTSDLDVFYGQIQVRPLVWLSLMLGGRSVRDSLSDVSDFEPRLSANIRLSEHVDLRGGYGKFTQFALRSPDTLNYFEGTETWFLAETGFLEPGRATRRHVGVRYQRGPWLLDGSFYDKRLTGSLLPIFSRFSDGFLQTEDEIRGGEFWAQWVGERLQASLGYRRQETEVVRILGEDERLGWPIDRDVPDQVKTAVSLTFGRWVLAASWRYASGRPYDIPIIAEEDGEFYLDAPVVRNAERLPVQHQLDVGLRFDIPMRRWTGALRLDLANVYDRRNVIYRYYSFEDDERQILSFDVRDFGFEPSVSFDIRF